jgi:hypothetical protein
MLLMYRYALLLIAGCLFAQEADPISDRMRYEIAAAQRDYLIAKQQLDTAGSRLKEKVDLAQKACSAQSATFDLAQFVCAPNPTAKNP